MTILPSTLTLSAIAILVLPTVVVASAQGRSDDPAALLQVATDRLDRAIAFIRASGNMADGVADIRLAEEEFRRAAGVFSQRNDREHELLAIVRSADCLRILQQWSAARERYDQAIARHPAAELEAKAWAGVAKVERFSKQDYRAASDAVTRALALLDGKPEAASLRADLLLESVELSLQVGAIDTALKSGQEAVTLTLALDDLRLRASAFYGWSNAHARASDRLYSELRNLPYRTTDEWLKVQEVAKAMSQHLADATDHLTQARDLAARAGDAALANGMTAELSLYGPVKASQDRTVALLEEEHARLIDPPATRAATLVPSPMAFSWHRQGTLVPVTLLGPALPVSGEPATRRFIESARRELGPEPTEPSALWRYRYLQGQLLEGEQNVQAAIDAYATAATLIDRERRLLPSDTTRAGFAADKIKVIERLVLLHLNRGQFDEAFYWNEHIRARSLAETLTSPDVRLSSATEQRLLDEVRAARLENAALTPSAAPAARAAAEARYDRAVARIRTEAPRLLDLVESQPATLAQVREVIRRERFDLVYYLVQSDRLVVWHIGPERMDARAFFAPASELARLSAALGKNLTLHEPFASDVARDLYFLLVGPLREQLETSHVVFALAPELESVPFAVLQDTRGSFFDDTVAISYTPSASVLVKRRPGLPLAEARILALAGPGLALAEEEARDLANRYTSTEVIGPAAASRSRLVARLPGHNVLHFAAHGTFADGDPMRSTIQLQAETGHSGFLTAAEMMGLPLAQIELVTVASCEAARVQSGPGQEAFGITRSLLFAGAQNVLLPLWRVDDRATREWMNAFYDVARTTPLAEAVQQANARLRRHAEFGSDPRLWAAFKLVGR